MAAFGFLLQRRQTIGVVHREAHAGRDEDLRMVGLQPRRLIGDQSVGGGVGFVEAVVGEFGHEVEYLGRLGGVDAAFGRAFLEDGALFFHFLLDFLAHRAAQEVGAAEAISRHFLRNLHDLFLIDHNAVGLGQDVVDFGVRGFPFLAVLAAVIIRNVCHGAGAIQRHGGDQVLETVGAHLAQCVAHALAFHLEHPAGLATCQHLVGFLVVQGQVIEIDLDPEFAEVAFGAIEDG